jgi:uncharacterized membrane protein YdbT with pleckstrin-like domain
MPKQLLENEHLVLPPLRRHWIVLVRGIAPLTILVLAVEALVNVVARNLVPGDLRVLVTLAAVAALGLWIIVVWLTWASDALTVTDQRVVLEEGLLQRSSRVIPLNRVQDVSTTQSLFGRLLDYGTVEIHTAGSGGADYFRYLGRPEWVRDQVFVLAERLFGRR